MSSLQKHHETLSAFFNDQSRTPAKVTALVDAAARIMAEPAKHMLKNAGLSSDTVEPFVLLDHGCGAGTVAELLQDLINGGILTRSRILCADVSEAMVGLVKERSQKWVSVEAMTLDAMVSSALDPDQVIYRSGMYQ